MILDGENISLVPIGVDDVNDLYLSWLHDPDVMKGIVTGGYRIESLRAYVVERTSCEMTVFNKIIWKKNNLHIGNIKLDFFDSTSNTSELGILIGNKNYWGKGVGLEACSLMIDYGFKSQGLSKIRLAVFGNNLPALNLYKKLGFITEEILKSNVFSEGQLQDRYLMAIFNKEDK